MANAINSLNFNNNTYTFTLPYGTCSTAAATAAKTVNVDNFSLETGARVLVKFTVTNSASSPTLNVESTGAKPIYYRGAAISAAYLAKDRTYEFVYNGTQWELIGDIDTNTKYTAATAIPVVAGTGAVGASSKYAREDHVHPAQTDITGNAGTATKLKAAKTITLSGDVSGSASFDGGSNITITTVVADNSHNHTNIVAVWG